MAQRPAMQRTAPPGNGPATDVSGALAEKPSSKLKQSSPFLNGRPRKHVYGHDVDLAPVCFGSQHGHHPLAAPTLTAREILASPAHAAEARGRQPGGVGGI